MTDPQLLGAAQIRQLAQQLSITPTKKLGQNFVIDPNTVRRIAQEAHFESNDVVVEIGPGLGSLTLAILPHVSHVLAVEIDTLLSGQLPATIKEYAPDFVSNISVINDDAMTISELPLAPTKLVANLPYNISVPVVLHFLATFPSIRECLVMVQAEVADRMAAGPGSRTYGVPSVKLAWYGNVTKAGAVGRNVFWPAPNVNSGLVRIVRGDVPGDEALRRRTFAIVDSAFNQRRKTLRSSLNQALGSSLAIEEILGRAGIEPGLRGEQLALADFVAIAQAADGVQ